MPQRQFLCRFSVAFFFFQDDFLSNEKFAKKIYTPGIKTQILRKAAV